MFETLNYDLLIAQLETQGFSLSSLTYIRSYLEQRLQRIEAVAQRKRYYCWYSARIDTWSSSY